MQSLLLPLLLELLLLLPWLYRYEQYGLQAGLCCCLIGMLRSGMFGGYSCTAMV